jgi:hypothetical protein
MPVDLSEVFERFGQGGTHLGVNQLSLTMFGPVVYASVQTGGEPGNIFLTPFMDSAVVKHSTGVLIAQLPSVLTVQDVAMLAANQPGRTEVHGIDTLPACLDLAARVSGGQDLLTKGSVLQHTIRRPITGNLQLVAGHKHEITAYKGSRTDNPALECRVGVRGEQHVFVRGYQESGSRISRVYVGQLGLNVRGGIQILSQPGDAAVVLRVPLNPSGINTAELREWPIKAINYALDLGQGVIQEHLAGGEEPQEIRERPLYITRTSNVNWAELPILFCGKPLLEVTVDEKIPVPSSSSGTIDTWGVKMRVSNETYSDSWLEATVVVVRTPELL